MDDLDSKLFSSYQTSYPESEWQEIAEHVVGKLGKFLGQPVAASHINFTSNGFNGDIENPTAFAGRLRISWFGRIGTDGIDHEGSRVLVAFLFLRGAGKRLVTIDGLAYLYLQYKKAADGRGGWTEPEWDKDIFGEFEDWE